MLRTWLALVHLKLRTSPWRRKGHVSSLQRRKRLAAQKDLGFRLRLKSL
jgi:hypothetical protein